MLIGGGGGEYGGDGIDEGLDTIRRGVKADAREDGVEEAKYDGE